MYITATEYNTITGRPASEATTYRITVSSKLLDSRIGNYIIQDDGYKIDSSTWKIWWNGVLTELPTVQKDGVKLWTAQMISFLTDNNNNPPAKGKDIKLGRFSVDRNSSNTISLNNPLPSEMSFADQILITSGIINKAVKMK